MDTGRRTHAAHLAAGEGILVCPTNAGGLLGVDLLTNSLVWAYGYREKGYSATTQMGDPRFGQPPPGMMFTPQGQLVPVPPPSATWKDSPPIIVQGRVVFTAPDAGAVKAFVRNHRLLPQFHYLTGSRPTLERIWREYSVSAVRNRKDGGVDHTLYTMLIDRGGTARVLFDAPANAVVITHDVRQLLAD